MTKSVKSLVAVFLMGVPIWMVIAGLTQDPPASLLIHLTEPDVRVWVGDQGIDAESTTVGPIDVIAGEHMLRVTRGHTTLYEYPIVVQKGERKEISVRWITPEVSAPAGGTLTDAGEQRFEGHGDVVNALGFSSDGAHVVSASSDGTVRVWDAIKGRQLRVLKGRVGKEVAVAAPEGSRQVLTVGDDAVVRYWDLASGREVRSVATGVFWAVRCAAISPDGKRVSLGCQSGIVIVYDLENGVEIRRHSIAPASVGGLAFSPRGETLLVGLIGDPQTPHDVQVLDVASGRILTRLHGHEAPVWSVAFLPDGRRAVSAGSDRTLRLWDVATGRELKRFDDHPGVVLCLAVSPDGRRAIAGTGHLWSEGWKLAGSYGLQVWDLDAGIGLGRFETNEPIRTLVLSPDGRRAFGAGDDRVIHAWDLPTGPTEIESQRDPG
jgi:WD40 repeat protein